MAVAAEVEAVSATLAGAFFHDPVWAWAFSDASARLDQLDAWFRVVVGRGIERGWVWTMADHQAATVWVPPGQPELTEADELELEAVLAARAPGRASVVMEVFDRFEAAHPHDREHVYLSLFGTHPDHRGAGLGMQVLRANLAEVDRLGMPAYLESSNPANLARYQSVGFEVTGQFSLPADGPDVTTMWRPAARTTRSS